MTKTSTTWKKGQSGNPAGRKAGTGRIEEYRALLDPHVPDLLKTLVAKAKDGDLFALRMILERVYPVRDAAMADLLADIEDLRTVIDENKVQGTDPDTAALLQEIEALRQQINKGTMQ